MKIIIGILLISCFLGRTTAQNANYKRAEETKAFSLPWKYDRLTPFFTEGSDDFWYSLQTNDGEKYFYVDLKNKKVEEFIDPVYLATEMEKATGRKYNPKKLGLWKIHFKKGGRILSWRDGRVIFNYNRITKKLGYTNLPSESDMPPIHGFFDSGMSPDGKYQVFGKNHNAYIRNLEDSTVVQLTFDGTLEFSYMTGWGDVKEEVPLAPVWFEDSKNFYLFRQNSHKVAEISNMNYLKGRPLAYNTQAVLAGDSIVLYDEISLFDVETKTQKKIKIDKWQDQLTRVLHSDTKNNKLFLERRTRRNNILEVCDVNLKTGDVKVIIHEEGDPYIGIELASIHFINNYNDIIWWSERSGYGHFYHYDREGNLKNAITSGEWTAGKIVEIDEKNRTIFFQAYGIAPDENPSYAKICKANIDEKSKVTILTPEEATHEVIFSPSKRYIIDAYSRPDLPCRFSVRDIRGKLIASLGEVNLDDLYKKGWKMPETFSVKSADGETDLYGVMWKPFDFDSTKKYPIISCVYPGPQTDNVPLIFGVGSTNEALAQIGCIVVAFNHTGGIPFRGRAYHSFGYNNIRDHALADDKCGLEQLIKRHPYIDGNKVGIYGHSGGGMMSTAAICTYPDFYKACVSSAGNHDNNIYSQFFVESHYAIDEQIVKTQDSIKTANGKDSVVTKTKTVYTTNLPTNMELAKNLKGHLMLIVGNMDGNVHPAQTIRMADALINHGKDFELVFLPRGRHTYDGVSEWYFEHKLRSHFAKYLLGDFTNTGFYDIKTNEYDQVIK